MSDNKIWLHPDKVEWQKSTYSNGPAGCVEVADLGFAMRDSKDPDGPNLHFTREEMEAHELGIAAGEFLRRSERTERPDGAIG
ncbi:MAG TPA: DUF397 domain-containing protein [Mycobacteriales bacterium]|nr:DUF397 domain-containing protein [Mycobacteriales bacterium]